MLVASSRRLSPKLAWLAPFACTTALLAHPAFAQPIRPAQQPAPIAAPPATAHQAFVLVAMTGDSAIDPYLRMTADDINRRVAARGFANVDPARVGQALAADPTAVGTLRARLGADCLVRVDVASHSPDRIVLAITVQTAAGDRTASVEGTPAEILARTAVAIDPLIPAAQSLPAPQAPAPIDRVLRTDGSGLDCQIISVTPGDVVVVQLPNGTRQSVPWAGISQILPRGAGRGGNEAWGWTRRREPNVPRTEPSNASWEKRGGSIISYGIQAEIVGLLARQRHGYSIQYPDAQTMSFTGEPFAGGGGGGIGANVSFLQLSIPNRGEGGTLLGFRIGTGFDLGVVAFGYRKDSLSVVGQTKNGKIITPDDKTGGQTEWTSSSVFMFPLTIGPRIGVGSFGSESSWHGVMVGFDWRPTYSYASPSGQPSIGGFNYGGVQAHIDVATLNANAPGPEGNFELTAFYLPRLGDRASFAGLGFGAVWY